ncbi:unnamed protein product [Clavelina lepadiformis]|uniref:Caspase-8 n=1 Tax=Clavelina lepadiformis TaxID=159417 RepID=A0ABP0G817_CLALP
MGIVMEYVPEGNLRDFLLSKKVSKIPWLLRLRFYCEITNALSYLHRTEIISVASYDFRPEKILLTWDLCVKIAASSSTSSSKTSWSSSSFYVAPELLRDPSLQKELSSDVYSVGIVCYDIITRHEAFADVTLPFNLVLAKITIDGEKPSQKYLDEVEESLENEPENVEIFKFMKSIMVKCWDFDPTKRPEAQKIYEEIEIMFQSKADDTLNFNISDLKEDIDSGDTIQESMKRSMTNCHFRHHPSTYRLFIMVKVRPLTGAVNIRIENTDRSKKDSRRVSLQQGYHHYQDGPPHNKADKYGSSMVDEFYYVIEAIDPSDWGQFARGQLQLPHSFVQNVRHDYDRDIMEQKYQMLVMWDKQNEYTPGCLKDKVKKFYNRLQDQNTTNLSTKDEDSLLKAAHKLSTSKSTHEKFKVQSCSEPFTEDCELVSEVLKPNVKQFSENITSGLQSNQSLTVDVDLNKTAPIKSAMKRFSDEGILDFGTSDKKTALQAPSKTPQHNFLPSAVDFLTMDYSPLQTSLITGKQGGLVKLGGCVIEIPEGAMKENMFFSFMLIYIDEAYEEILRKIKLTPTLKCSPSYKFEKAVTITLPTCYLPNKSDVLVTPQTKHEKNWSCLEQVRFGDEFSITFKDSSFCKKTVLGDAGDIDKKRLLFKHYKDPDDESGRRIVWTILDGDVFVEESLAQQHFYLDIKRGQNLMIQLHSPNIDFERGRITVKSEVLFQQRFIKRLFSVIDHDDTMVPLLDDVYKYDVIDESSGDVLHSGGGSFKLTSPSPAAVGPSPISDEHAHSDGQVVVHPASQSDYDNHLRYNDIYQIVQRPKAHVLFLYNTRFPAWSTEADLRQIEPKLDLLRQLFEGLDCQVHVRSNISAEEMKETIIQFSASDRHTDFCALFIVSHGGHVESVGDVVYASDAEYLTISEITSFFTPTTRSARLVDKPRLLFFHCCRGVATDTGVRWISQMARPSLTDVAQELEEIQEEYRSLQPGYSVYHNPRSLHIATIQSTEEGYVAEFGRFFNAFINIFSQHSKDSHFMELMTQLTKAMARLSFDESK